MRNLNSISTGYSVADAQASFMRKVYTWMTGGVLLTALVSSYLGSNPELIVSLLRTPVLYYGLMIAQIGMVIAMSAAIARISAPVATGLFVSYAALTGVTLSTIFLVYTRDSIAGVFLSTACGFGGLALLGHTTRRDLGPVGAFCGMAVFGLIGWGLLSMFFPNLMGGAAGTAYSVIGVLVFAGLTAYDAQKIKQMALGRYEDEGMESKAAIVGALALYLDFINLFLSLLRLFGDRRR